jgi:hypothetical protein
MFVGDITVPSGHSLGHLLGECRHLERHLICVQLFVRKPACDFGRIVLLLGAPVRVRVRVRVDGGSWIVGVGVRVERGSFVVPRGLFLPQRPF